MGCTYSKMLEALEPEDMRLDYALKAYAGHLDNENIDGLTKVVSAMLMLTRLVRRVGGEKLSEGNVLIYLNKSFKPEFAKALRRKRERNLNYFLLINNFRILCRICMDALEYSPVSTSCSSAQAKKRVSCIEKELDMMEARVLKKEHLTDKDYDFLSESLVRHMLKLVRNAVCHDRLGKDPEMIHIKAETAYVWMDFTCQTAVPRLVKEINEMDRTPDFCDISR